MNEVTDFLIEAKNLINISGWRQGGYASDSAGFPTELLGDKAVNFCIRGSLVKMCQDYHNSLVRKAEIVFCQANGFSYVLTDYDDLMDPASRCHPIVQFNDDPNTTKEMVLDAFDKAIAYSKDNDV